MDNKLSFIKNVFSFSLLTYISFLLSFLSAPISTRIYPPEQMGIINMFSTYAALITSLAYLGLDQAYVRFYNEPPDGKSSKTLLTFCTGVTSSFVLLLGVVVLAFGEDVSEIVVGRADGIIPICLVIAAISGVCIRFLNLNYRMKQRALMYTIQGVCLVFFNKILYVVVGFWNPTYKYAIISMTSLQFMLAIVFVFIQKREFQFKNIKVSKRFITSIAGFAVPLIPITFLSWANNSLSQIVLKHYLDFTALGIYSSAVGIASMINVVQSGFNTYWAPYVYKNYEKKDNKFWTVHKVITTLLVLCGLVIIFAQDIIFILLGESYRSSKTFFPFLLVSPICYTITETTGLGINISKKTFWNSIIFCVNVISNLTFSIILIPLFGVEGAAFASALSAVIYLIVKTIIGEKYYKSIKSYSYIIKTLLIILLACFANYIFFANVILKYIAFLVIAIITIICFYKEIKLLFETFLQILKTFLKDKKQRKSL